MKNYKVTGGPISTTTLKHIVDECNFTHESSTSNSFPFRIGVNWYWAIFMADTLIGFEVYGFNDPKVLIDLGKQYYFNVIEE